MKDFTISELRGLLSSVVTLLEEKKGYSVLDPSINVYELTIVFTCSLSDPFQEMLDYSQRVSHGYQAKIFEETDELWTWLFAFPSRSEREMRVLLNTSGRALEASADMTSAFAESFVKALRKEHEAGSRLLADLREQSYGTNQTADDEVLF